MASSSGTVVDSSVSTSSHIPIPSNCFPNDLKAGSIGTKTPPNSPWQPAGPWGLKNNGFPQSNTSFEEVMSEQLANQLQIAEDEIYSEDIIGQTVKEQLESDPQRSQPTVEDADTLNDLIIAQMLQAKMDKEYNEFLSKQERHVNQNSKVKLSFSKYRTDETFQSDDDEDNDSDDENYVYANKDASLSSNNANSDPSTDMLHVKKDKGYVMFGKTYVTKHDLEISGRKNTARLEDSFPAEFNTGDARGMDLQLSNKIYNSLKRHAYSEQRRGQRLHEDKEHYTAEHAVDEKTRLILHRMVDRGLIASVNGVISIGKEAVVIHADGGDIVADEADRKGHDDFIVGLKVPKECVIKVYKTTLNEFKARDKYIKDDYRFKDRFKKLNPRKIIHMWAEKEMHNLNRMTQAGISCPEVVLLRKHVLVMSFIGYNQQPAPKLKDAILSTSQRNSAYDQVLSMMKTLYRECNLVHADLSEFNLLWHENKVWTIDVSQSVEPSHPNALEFLLRDCLNVSKFFTNLGVADVHSPMELFNEVSGLEIPITDETSFRSSIGVLQNSAQEHAQQGRKKSSQILEQNVVPGE